ncbi:MULTISPECIES: ABC transporter ATP-binding protein/permease [unclassified Enterococcus]|uniref:ABC transporter ATP-binding protein/permease n=1 Tax=unclassified Enterococcus TaxID=2608891 RepID=UPI001907C91A|nr:MULTISPECIES: ABC transporter ATP-binding protein/permease [unclassified Enterococcus]MBK0037187.1 ABC transporter ATP-binding protein/permease [Enterococcus sp. S52]MBK0069850.1 ABC transporter ATP-binding protein/permease [Enterococcus sp. S53]MBK0140443.1 ABC transporter ATP-binding protein/permease [Enterococcus sp. S76]MBK0143884.1 ABC transporter ATP-binding protein/permease [Enterococcus sp. S77]
MLELKDIKKYYTVGSSTTKALDGVTVAFRKQEFVAILGPSGSGKTTMLNVIGGLDNYDSGDMIINGKSTKSFKDRDWDAYRNNSIGFVFQSYNLISHLGIIDNVELGMTLSGVSKEEKRAKATDALTRVGLAEHMHKKPNQLSGGQMQRVAIARALANDPDILLCDEPTGALDSETSVQIMELIQELSKEKLVIMVTHNPELAHKYAGRIIEFKDGRIIKDSTPHVEGQKKDQFELKHTKMSFMTALRLSFNNIRTKKGRTFLTAFASSIGIIGIAIVLSLSTGFQKQIDNTQSETLARFPITISQVATEQDPSAMGTRDKSEDFPSDKEVTAKLSDTDRATHINKIDQEFLDYINDIDPELSNNIGYTRSTSLNLFRKIDDTVEQVSFSNASPDNEQTNAMMSAMSASTGIGVSTFPEQLSEDNGNFLKDNYDLLEGSYPSASTDVVLIVDENNVTNVNALINLGFDIEDGDKVSFDDIVGTKITLASNDAFYTELPTGNFIPNQDLNDVFDNSNNKELTISGILRIKQNSTMNLLSTGIAYSDALAQEVIKENQDSAIVQAQKDSDTNVMTNEPVDESAKDSLIAYLGGSDLPNSIMIYPNDFSAKEKILDYLDDFNKGKDKEDQIVYSDLAGTMTQLTGGLMDAITYVLIAFAGISLVTSMIMIGIITYTSVLERTKEIGVLKALGARKKDITRVFDAETCILGIASGALGVLIAWLATFPINAILYSMTDLENVAQLNPVHGLILIAVSTVLTMIGGHIPARMAAKKDAAIALRAD